MGSKTLENTDQLISEDIELLSTQFASIYTNLLKPIVDLVIFTIKLAVSMEITGLLLLLVVVVVNIVILIIFPSFYLSLKKFRTCWYVCLFWFRFFCFFPCSPPLCQTPCYYARKGGKV